MTKRHSSRIVFTVCNLAYLPRALALSESLRRTSNQRLRIYLFERELPDRAQLPTDIDIELAHAQGFERFSELAFKYDVTELTTSLKPFLALKLFDAYEQVMFLDPDTFVTGDTDRVWNLLANNSVLLTPHYLTPEPDDAPDADLAMMRFGSFNLGFFAARRDASSFAFLRWWHARCIEQCYFESQFGLSTDQKWVSIAPCFFDCLHVVRDSGFNVAFWNLRERRISISDGRYWVNGISPLMFFHFSSFPLDKPEQVTTRRQVDPEMVTSALANLAREYAKKVGSFTSLEFARPYSYGYFTSGHGITMTLRRAYACKLKHFAVSEDPFSSDSEVFQFAKRNNLLTSELKAYAPAGFSDVSRYRRTFAVIFLALRGLLLVVGPRRFYDFSRLFVYLSLFRRLDKFWRHK